MTWIQLNSVWYQYEERTSKEQVLANIFKAQNTASFEVGLLVYLKVKKIKCYVFACKKL